MAEDTIIRVSRFSREEKFRVSLASPVTAYVA